MSTGGGVANSVLGSFEDFIKKVTSEMKVGSCYWAKGCVEEEKGNILELYGLGPWAGDEADKVGELGMRGTVRKLPVRQDPPECC